MNKTIIVVLTLVMLFLANSVMASDCDSIYSCRNSCLNYGKNMLRNFTDQIADCQKTILMMETKEGVQKLEENLRNNGL